MAPEYFDSSVLKINKDGDTVLSTYLDDGEELVGGRTSQPVYPPLGDGDQTVITTMTSDETNTSTWVGEEKVDGKPVERKILGTEDSDDESSDDESSDDESSDDSADSNDSSDDSADSNDDSADSSVESTPEQPKGVVKREWYDYAKAIDPEFDTPYEDITQGQLAEKYGK